MAKQQNEGARLRHHWLGMTPIAETVRYDLDRAFAELDKHRLTRWQVLWSAGKPVEIEDCRGGRIYYSGLEFEGSPRQVFWSFIRPCLEEVIDQNIENLEKALESYSLDDRERALEETLRLFHAFVTKTYRHMVVLDRRMRGKGFPGSVHPYDPTREIAELNGLAAGRVEALRRHYLRRNDSPRQGTVHRLWSAMGLPQIALIVAVLIGLATIAEMVF